MKAIAIAALAAICLLAGCTLFQSGKIPTPQQLVTDFCPVVNADLKLLGASTLLTPAQQQVLNGVPNDPTKPGIIAMNAAVCAAGGQINVTDLQTLAATGFPALLGLVEALPMLPNQPDIVFGLILAQPILTQIVNQLTNPAAPAAPASGASAPVPASA
jgi:hypothetical protein